MVDTTLNYLYAKVRVIHFGINRFIVYAYTTSSRLSIVIFVLGRTV